SVDPAFAPGTGTPEVGGFTSYEALLLVRALKGIRFVGADVVEVLPAYDTAEMTAMLAANVTFEILSLIALAKGEPGAPASYGARQPVLVTANRRDDQRTR